MRSAFSSLCISTQGLRRGFQGCRIKVTFGEALSSEVAWLRPGDVKPLNADDEVLECFSDDEEEEELEAAVQVEAGVDEEDAAQQGKGTEPTARQTVGDLEVTGMGSGGMGAGGMGEGGGGVDVVIAGATTGVSALRPVVGSAVWSAAGSGADSPTDSETEEEEEGESAAAATDAVVSVDGRGPSAAVRDIDTWSDDAGEDLAVGKATVEEEGSGVGEVSVAEEENAAEEMVAEEAEEEETEEEETEEEETKEEETKEEERNETHRMETVAGVAAAGVVMVAETDEHQAEDREDGDDDGGGGGRDEDDGNEGSEGGMDLNTVREGEESRRTRGPVEDDEQGAVEPAGAVESAGGAEHDLDTVACSKCGRFAVATDELPMSYRLATDELPMSY